MNCQSYDCGGKLTGVGKDWYCEECDEHHVKIGDNFILAFDDRIEEVDFGKCSNCDSKLYIGQSGADISIRCSGCENNFRVM